MRRSTLFLAVIAALAGTLAILFVHARSALSEGRGLLEEQAAMVRQYGLTDLCLFTEARYTRHPSQADLHTAFQDHPLSLEHFPSGSLLPPPQPLKEQYGSLDRTTTQHP
jgi:hypothetical protein